MRDSEEQSSPIVHERMAIDGDRRRLEGILAYPQTKEPAFAALVAGPHPFLGGDLDNNLVSVLMDELPRYGGLVLTFNYSGVGKSDGGPRDWAAAMSQFWRDGFIPYESRWADDAIAAWDTLCALVAVPRVLVGYSFGCWTASQCIGRGDVDSVVLISPNVRKHDLVALKDSNAPLLVLSSDNDFTCTTNDVTRWLDGVCKPKTLEVLEAGEHFFRGHEREVAGRVVQHLRNSNICGDGHER